MINVVDNKNSYSLVQICFHIKILLG